VHSKDRSSLTFKLGYAIRHPGRIAGYIRRHARDAWLRMHTTDHVSYYRAVMRSDAARSREGAVGSHTHESWLELGKLQFDYATSHGLKPEMRMLEIGCGNLRAGRLFIDYLEPGNYYGMDISPDILLGAQDVVAEHGLAAKLPHLTLVKDLKLAFLPDEAFDWAGIADDVTDRVAEVLALVDRCCDVLLDVEYRTVCRMLLARIASRAPEVFRRKGRVETAAAGVVWIAGKANYLFDGKSGVRAMDIAKFFAVTSSPSARGTVMLRAGGFPGGGFDERLGSPVYLVAARRRRIIERRDALRQRIASAE